MIQHDRFFLRPLRLSRLLSIFHKHPGVNSICFGTHNTDNYTERIHAKFKVDIRSHRIESEQISLLPMIIWLDSTHIARTKWYKEFVFDESLGLVARGGFIEDRLGQVQLERFKKSGLASHKGFGTYLLPVPDTVTELSSFNFGAKLIERRYVQAVRERIPWVRHLNGRRFLEESQRQAHLNKLG